jgi:hypothetical protein
MNHEESAAADFRAASRQKCTVIPTDGRDGGASAPPPALPCLEEDNCTKPVSARSLFLTQENLRLYIQNFGENEVAVLTVTMPSLCLSAVEFQKVWHSWRTHELRKRFPTGMWIRERQPRSGSIHAHAVVHVGYDIRTGFPFAEVEKRFYANVDARTRALWKWLRETSEKYGFGRTELLPIKSGGPACARYLVKYLGKARSTDKLAGEEKCRLFGVWGGVRFVSSAFCFLSSRIIHMRKIWLAHELGSSDFATMFGSHWWFHLGSVLMEAILPEKYYQIAREGKFVWDDLGTKTFCADVARFAGSQSIDSARSESWYRVFWEVGKLLYKGDEGQVRDYALHKISRRPEVAAVVDPQLLFKFTPNPKKEG